MAPSASADAARMPRYSSGSPGVSGVTMPTPICVDRRIGGREALGHGGDLGLRLRQRGAVPQPSHQAQPAVLAAEPPRREADGARRLEGQPHVGHVDAAGAVEGVGQDADHREARGR